MLTAGNSGHGSEWVDGRWVTFDFVCDGLLARPRLSLLARM